MPYVYREARPEIFFKGTARVCVASGQNIGIRVDSKFTAPEPELACRFGDGGPDRRLHPCQQTFTVLGTSERENALLLLPQSKTYDCCSSALGPAMVTADAMPESVFARNDLHDRT